uniref:Uncharacterized protein n=1 Tax=Chromera velia CCMP2878 TaxID=1169474 RepID=A0A0G4GXH8_9ALVE|eukprot:Cvel_774.t1-p1 / transcript=Cvel_774.t1 / gene=Cvel_774 / organism=Chromera_velia_CCMP2878 / gene_product=hypothetical protein / transcript_product=hypothetical protein / location=Cvel_scaffold24:50459-51741(-) / protein_length=346 / sequence_SO=supercontig / SO=protein_coding / is_pseudo=false
MEGEIPTADLIEIDWQLQQNPRLQALMLAPPGHDSQTAFSELHQFLFPPNPDPLGIPTDPRSALSIQPGAPVRSPGQTASDPLARKRGGGDATVPSLLLDARSFQTALAERVPEKHPEDSREMDPVFDAIRGEEIVNARSSQAVCRLLAKKPTPALPSSFTPPCPLPDSTQIPMSEITRLRMQLHEGFTDALSAADELLINPQTASLLGRRLKDYSPPPLRLVDATGGSTNPEEGGQVALAQRLLVSEMQSMRHRLKDIHDELDAARERAEERVRLKKGRGEVEEQCKGKERRDKTKQTDPTICPQGKAVQSVEKDFGWGGNFGNRPKLPSLRRVWDSPMAPPKSD